MSDSGTKESRFHEEDEPQQEIPEILPVLPIIDDVIYPYTIVPLLVSEQKGIQARMPFTLHIK